MSTKKPAKRKVKRHANDMAKAKAAAVLAAGGSGRAAAEAAGVAESTVRNWRKRGFLERKIEEERKALEPLMADLAVKAAEVLKTSLTSGDLDDFQRAKVAGISLTNAARLAHAKASEKTAEKQLTAPESPEQLAELLAEQVAEAVLVAALDLKRRK